MSAPLKIAIVTGSHREKSQSDRVGSFVEGVLKTQNASPFIISLSKNPLPLWDEGVWSSSDTWTQKWNPIATQLQESDGLVVVSPEWSGMVPPGLKNFLLLCSPKEVGHKPALIVSVSSGIGGSYPVSELRTSSYKNNRLVYIPEHVIVRNVEELLNGDMPANEHDETTRARLTYGSSVLLQYAQALKSVRSSAVIDYKKFPYGM
jgi:NAD(P)H-dependent FMN reductase